MSRIGVHNHTGGVARVLVNKVVNLARDKATTSQAFAHFIATEAFVGVPKAVVGQLPNIQNLKRSVRNSRRIENQAPPNPLSLLELEITLQYAITHYGELFCLHDDKDGPGRQILFSTFKNLQLLS
ncbi:unnamed protein product [Lepeophtheirus salmonis]|uniref:(salmon louse) hypothetical protein n=1 Tax=Lepeophtheirus salmonis TaxID=72036 RepID=A0A7R8CGY1_LEPSM|nr:unnamed protein product [Lepeophtheirus salmonis]CAF2819628.1 unnamed protein product [Lepeophtheirus salmonis]